MTTPIETKRRIRTAEERLNFIEATGLVGTWYWDFTHGGLSWSRGFYRLLGLEPLSVAPSTSIWQDLVHPDDRADLSDPVALHSASSSIDKVYRIIRPDRSLRSLRIMTQVFHGPDGRPESVAGVAFDVTDADQSRAQLRRQASLLKLVEDSPGTTLWTRVLRANETHPTPPPQWLVMVAEDDKAAALEAWTQAVLARSELRFRHRSPDGSTWCLSTAVPVRNGEASIEAWVGLTTRSPAEQVPTRGAFSEGWALRAARAALGWSGNELARKSGVSFSTVRRLESEVAERVRPANLEAIREALERAGIRFVVGPDGSLGVSRATKTLRT